MDGWKGSTLWQKQLITTLPHLKVLQDIRVIRHGQLLLQSHLNVRHHGHRGAHPKHEHNDHHRSHPRLHQERRIGWLKHLQGREIILRKFLDDSMLVVNILKKWRRCSNWVCWSYVNLNYVMELKGKGKTVKQCLILRCKITLSSWRDKRWYLKGE